jgi:hypothetical protein
MNMSQNQETVELPKIKLVMGNGPEFILTFKSENQKTQWIKEHNAILFSDDYLLLESHLCLCQIEQIETKNEPAKPARVPMAIGKAQTFYTDASGKSTKPY